MNWGKTIEIEIEWGPLDGNKAENSADQIDQLNALRLKCNRNVRICQEKSGKISESEMPGVAGGIPTEETYNKYDDAAGKLKSRLLGDMGSYGDTLFGNTGRGVFN